MKPARSDATSREARPTSEQTMLEQTASNKPVLRTNSFAQTALEQAAHLEQEPNQTAFIVASKRLISVARAREMTPEWRSRLQADGRAANFRCSASVQRLDAAMRCSASYGVSVRRLDAAMRCGASVRRFDTALQCSDAMTQCSDSDTATPMKSSKK